MPFRVKQALLHKGPEERFGILQGRLQFLHPLLRVLVLNERPDQSGDRQEAQRPRHKAHSVYSSVVIARHGE